MNIYVAQEFIQLITVRVTLNNAKSQNMKLQFANRQSNGIGNYAFVRLTLLVTGNCGW